METVRAFGEYAVERRLRSGGLAELFLVRRAGAPAVVKALHTHLAGEPRALALFDNERRLLGRLDHPNVVRLLVHGQAASRPYIVLELVDAPSLEELRERGVRWPPEVIRSVLLHLCEGLHAVHEAGIVHRDVSPANVLVTPSFAVKIIDFGLARSADLPDPVERGAWLGTAAYTAPEQLEGREVDRRADLFSVGVIAYELFAAERLFWRGNAAATLLAVAEARVPSLHDRHPELSAALDHVLARALARDPGARYPTALALCEAIFQSA
jgi:eukaryotic-like serine/threonine-protein kinase